ncbi:endonuclease/exonuclease/phosphatase family protein [Aestuariimicrobium sp. Y1814]|uniref:endonuclease/exonuclease/phosphatase family protein n=1 Tax=Aestuariimicrobium sp. Y1814 TaxID=3418742 RepID=UPI003DA7507E
MAWLVIAAALMVLGIIAAMLFLFPSLQLVNRHTVMAAAFIPYGMPAFAGAALLLATCPTRWLRPVAVVAVAGLVLQVAWTRPYWPATAPQTSGTAMTLMTMNMRCDSRGLDDLASLTERVTPDVAVLQGMYAVRGETLSRAWQQILPHKSFHPMPDLPECGTLVFSRTPIRVLSGAGEVQPVVEVSGPNGPLVLLPVDLPTPSKGVGPWLDGFEHLTAAITAHQGRALVAAGDFNAVREHAPLRDLLADTGLRDAAAVAGSGWAPTFPAGAWYPPLIGLDHVLISPGLGAAHVRTEAIGGQQHRALTALVGRT